MTLGIVNINSCMTSKLPIIKKKMPCDNGISCKQIFTLHSINMIGNTNNHFNLPIIVFQINSISLIESEKFRETSSRLFFVNEIAQHLKFYSQ